MKIAFAENYGNYWNEIREFLWMLSQYLDLHHHSFGINISMSAFRFSLHRYRYRCQQCQIIFGVSGVCVCVRIESHFILSFSKMHPKCDAHTMKCKRWQRLQPNEIDGNKNAERFYYGDAIPLAYRKRRIKLIFWHDMAKHIIIFGSFHSQPFQFDQTKESIAKTTTAA